MGTAPVGLLVIRAWLEHGSEKPLRAEVRLTGDTEQGFERLLTLSEPASIEAVVHAWLADVLRGRD